jgi:hypothetical protein
MEVHSHSHTERKKWTHYFWEFLMLFLAVFCGFLAENLREHYVEHHRAKEYAIQMYDDLKKDTTNLNWAIAAIEKQVAGFDTVNVLFGQSPPVSNGRLIKAVLPWRATFGLSPTNTAFNQMKSSGSIRYFKNPVLILKITDYYDDIQPHTLQSFQFNDNFFQTNIQPFMLDHFDYNESDYNTDTLKVNNPFYLERSSKTDFFLRNRLILYSDLMNFTVNFWVKRALKKAIELVELIKKEYRLQ